MILGFVAMLGLGALTKVALPVHAEESPLTLSAKEYVPDKYDFHDYWGGVGDIDGGGVTTFAHMTGFVPLKGDAIRMRTSFMLLSKHPEGDNIDGWLTYSFSAAPGGASDGSFPAYSGGGTGYFLHITNFSHPGLPNTVEVQLVQSIEGQFFTFASVFIDNLVTNNGMVKNDEIVFDLILEEEENEEYVISFVNVATEAVIFTAPGLPLNKDLFVNELGQTFFSTAIYEGLGCDGNHWEHRGIRIYEMDAYTYDADEAEIVLSQDGFGYDGLPHKPTVTVSVGDYTLVPDVDYYVEGSAITDVGEGKLHIYFINDFAGNPTVVKTFTVDPIDASNAVVTLDGVSFTHTGNAIEPQVMSVVLGDITFVAGTDYTVTYLNNVEVGTGKVVITFKGNYIGEIQVDFAIVAPEPPASEPPASEPPASEPPASEPPASEPPASETPASETPASEPATGSEPTPPRTGCFGNIGATLSMSAAILGLAVILVIKRKRLV